MRIVFILLLAGGLWAQQAENVNLLYNYDNPDLPSASGIRYNDCWGYLGPNGEEIAIIGTLDSVLFFDITDPNQVEKLPGIAPGSSSLWRDFKIYENYCYVAADQGSEGLTIINMDSILAGVVTYQSDNSVFSRAHNIWIDTAEAKLYAVGSNTENDGLIIYDLFSDPYNPTVWAQYDLRDHGVSCSSGYVHDLYVRNDTAYCNMADCGYYVFDVSDTIPTILGSLDAAAFGSGYNHSNYVSEDGSFSVVAEETEGNPLYFVDLSDLTDMVILSEFKEPLLEPDFTDNIAHNPFLKENFCFTSYYHDGLQIIDVSNPSDPIRVGYYDTDPTTTNYDGFKGAWGTYPYFPSGNVIASDLDKGLYVLELDESLLAADWQSFTARYADERYFDLQTEFQTTFALDEVRVQWSPDGLAFTDWENIRPQKYTYQFSWEGKIPRPQAAAFYVRLQTTERDGGISYSPIRRVSAVPSLENMVYPQPASEQVQIKSTERGLWELWTMSGQNVLRLPIGRDIQTVDLPASLASGAYLAVWRSRSGAIRGRQTMIVQR